MPREAEDLTGRVYGHRKVLCRASDREWSGQKVIYWNVRCTLCGATADVQASSLKRGAGCQRCASSSRKQTAIGAPGGVWSPLPEHRKTPQRLVARDVAKVLLEKPGDQVIVQMVGDKGYAHVVVDRVVVTNQRVTLVVKLPAKLEPWST